MYREIIAVCFEIHIKHTNTLWAERRIVECKTSGAYNSHWPLKWFRYSTISSLFEVTEANCYNCGETRPPVENSTCRLRKRSRDIMHRNLQVKVNSEVQYILLLVSAIYGYHQVDNKNRKEVFAAAWV